MARLAFAAGIRLSPCLSESREECRELAKEEVVRTRIGDYSYEIRTRPCADKEEAFAHWSFRVYRVVPAEELLASGGDSPNHEHAERNARQLIALYIELDRMKSHELSGSKNARTRM
jgi:hypothetical protein